MPNVRLTQGLILAEPLYIVLASFGHPDAHEAVRVLSREATAKGVSVQSLFAQSEELRPYREQLTPLQHAVLADPGAYIGTSVRVAHATADTWEKYLSA